MTKEILDTYGEVIKEARTTWPSDATVQTLDQWLEDKRGSIEHEGQSVKVTNLATACFKDTGEIMLASVTPYGATVCGGNARPTFRTGG